MSRRGENIYKRKDGRWEGRYIKGHIGTKIQYGYVYARSYKDVKDKLSKVTVYKETVNRMDDERQIEMEKRTDNFEALARDWLETLTPQLKPSSIVKYTNTLNSYILPEFGDRKIVGINRSDVNCFGRLLLTEGGKAKNGLSPKTVNDILSVIKNIFNYALREHDLMVADLKGISVKQPHLQLRILSKIEQQTLDKYLRENLTFCNLGILICLYTGIRIGEICALKWGDIFFKEQCILIHKTMQRIQNFENDGKKTVVQISTPKSSSSIRKIPLPNDIFCLLSKTSQLEDAFLLTGERNHYMEPRTLQNRFKSVSAQCELFDVNFHMLRHTFATRCVELGFDVKSLSEILGHANVNITMNRYVHPSMELKKQNMNKLSNLFSVE